jgi:HEAT repeat protein
MADEAANGRRIDGALDARRLAGSRDYVRSLEQRADAEALGLLVQCLSDDSAYLRELAEAALSRRGASVAEALLPLLGQGLWFTRASAARVLGRSGHGAAAPGLLRLSRDAVSSVATEARAALVALARAGGGARLAWELHRLEPTARLDVLAGIRRLDEGSAARLEALLRAEPLMQRTDPGALRDDASFVREYEEGVAWHPPAEPREPGVRGTPEEGSSSR